MLTHRRRSGTLLKFGTAAIALSVMLLGGLNAARPDPANADPPDGHGPDTRDISDQMKKADAPIELADENGLPVQALGDENRVARVGDEKYWIALDDVRGTYYLKRFKLRAASEGAEAWVAVNLNFPTAAQTDPRTLDTDPPSPTPFGYNDCRNDGVRTVITDEQLTYILSEFDSNIRPTDVAWFGEPNKRTGTNAQLPGQLSGALGRGENSYVNRAGRDVILIDNVRDDNWYDKDNVNSFSYIAGFFTTAMPFYHDRNVITIDGFDWLHRTGPNPPHNPTADRCTSAPARPNLYEGVFAHEYQHLIHSDYDPDEVNWVNEGLSDLAEILTGYSHPDREIDEMGADSHILNFLGWASVAHSQWNPIPRPSGPENSLTVWEDQGGGEILADYGHAYYFMLYLQSLGYDQAFFTEWAHHPDNGIDGLNAALADEGTGDTFASLFLDMQTAALVDAFVDGGATVGGDATAAEVSNDGTNSTIHFTPNAYAAAGAPPWGSDYIPLGPGADLDDVVFNGDEEFVFGPDPQWVVKDNGYFAVVPSGHYASNADQSITHEVNLAPGSTLSFEHYYDLELGWDFGFVQISTDNGENWKSLACSGTTSAHDPGAVAPIVANMPGYTGTTGTAAVPLVGTCDLAAYTGDAIIAFRFMSDPAVEQDGWFVRDVEINDADVGTAGSLAGWSNQKFYHPAALDFTVRLVGVSGAVDSYGHVTSATSVVVLNLSLDAFNDGAATAAQLGALAGSTQVFAIVSGVPEAEDNGVVGPYSLLVNGDEAADGAIAVNPW